MQQKALIIGATGLTGSMLLQQLLADENYISVTVFARRSTGITHPKLREFLTDFYHIQEWAHLLTGDVLFSALGTTRRQAGSKAVQYGIDFTWQQQCAAAAAANGVPCYVLVSADGANAGSSFFYMRMKGELEQAVQQLSFSSVYLFRPGALDGNRKGRKTERLAIALLKWLNRLGIARRYRPTSVPALTAAMRKAGADQAPGVHIIPPQRID